MINVEECVRGGGLEATADCRLQTAGCRIQAVVTEGHDIKEHKGEK
jgi:hypothetical protein